LLNPDFDGVRRDVRGITGKRIKKRCLDVPDIAFLDAWILFDIRRYSGFDCLHCERFFNPMHRLTEIGSDDRSKCGTIELIQDRTSLRAGLLATVKWRFRETPLLSDTTLADPILHLGPEISEGRKSEADENQREQKQNNQRVESKGHAVSEASFQSEPDKNQNQDD
jgi:hypothetical protein